MQQTEERLLYYYIKGEKVLSGDGFVVIDAHGVGYRIYTSDTTLGKLGAGEVTVYTELVVREDAQELYGFATNDELAMFRHLTSVGGVGPKAALAVLSQMTPQALALAIISDDVKAITKAPGVGPKIARRIILELAGKLKNDDLLPDGISAAQISEPLGDNLTEAAAALAVLGYSASDARRAVSGLDEGLSVEDLVKQALKRLM